MPLSKRSAAALAAPALAALALLTTGASHAADFLNTTLKATSAVPAVSDPGWTPVHDLSWSVSSDLTLGPIGTGPVGRSTLSQVTWSQLANTYSSQLQRNQLLGRTVERLRFDRVDNGAASMSLDLKTAFVTQTAVAGGQTALGVYVPGSFTLGFSRGTSQTALEWDTTRNRVLQAGTNINQTIPVDAGTASAAAPGSVSTYLRLGTSNPGTSQAHGYENWITVDSTAWSVTSPVSGQVGAGVPVGRAEVGPLSWTQALDSTVIANLKQIVGSASLPQATLEFVTDAGAGAVTFRQLVLNDVYFTRIAASGDTVNQTVVFRQFTDTVWDLNPNGTRGKASVVSWDVIRQVPGSGSIAQPVSGFGRGQLSPTAMVVAELPPVPEPQTWALMLGGGALLLVRSRRSARG